MFSTRPWTEDDGDAGYPEEVNGVPVAEQIRTRRDRAGRWCVLVDGRFACTGPQLALGGPLQLQRYARRRLAAEEEAAARAWWQEVIGALALMQASGRGDIHCTLRSVSRWRTVAYAGLPNPGRTCAWRIRLWTGTSRGLPSSATSRSSSADGRAFSNFAISFTIISVLAGCFTTYPQAWNIGGPIAISWGWPIVCLLDPPRRVQHGRGRVGLSDGGRPLLVGEELGGPVWSWFTGWFNLLGLVAIVATRGLRVCAQFFTFVFNLWGLDFILNFADSVSARRDLHRVRGAS